MHIEGLKSVQRIRPCYWCMFLWLWSLKQKATGNEMSEASKVEVMIIL